MKRERSHTAASLGPNLAPSRKAKDPRAPSLDPRVPNLDPRVPNLGPRVPSLDQSRKAKDRTPPRVPSQAPSQQRVRRLRKKVRQLHNVVSSFVSVVGWGFMEERPPTSFGVGLGNLFPQTQQTHLHLVGTLRP